MKLFDINTSVGPSPQKLRFYDAKGLTRWMDDYHIDGALTYYTGALLSPWDGNRKMAQIADASGGRIKKCYVVNPSVLDESVAGEGALYDKLKRERPSAVRVVPDEFGCPFSAFYLRDMFEVFGALSLPVVVGGAYDDVFWRDLPGAAQQFPDMKIILLRVGFRQSRLVFPLLKYTKNVFFEISTMVDAAQIEEITEKFGSDRLLFGSGLPKYEPSGPLGLALYASIPEEDRENICYKNFERMEREIRYDA